MARASTFGEGSPLQLSRPAAAKTGTTTDWRDNWTVGYTPELVVGVWAGNADNQPMHHVSGVTGAAPIWHDVMEELLKGRPVREFRMPAGLVRVPVCADSGLPREGRAGLPPAAAPAAGDPVASLAPVNGAPVEARRLVSCPRTIDESLYRRHTTDAR